MFRKKILQKVKALGFTFIEVLIALTIFTVGILGIIALQGISLMATDFSGNMGFARILAADQMERISALNFTASSLRICVTPYCHKDIGSGVDGAAVVNIDFTGKVNGTGRFRREWEVSNMSPADANAREIRIRVRWTDNPGGPTNAAAFSFNRTLEMRTIKVNPTTL